MEFEFDKEIDVLLRQAARGESVFVDAKSETPLPKSPHLDADEISLFAENALSEKTKTLYAAHLADCRRCRKILANVAAQDFATAEKNAAAPQTSAVASFIPWYKRLFAAPKLVFSLGALLLVFAGLIGFTIRQSSDNFQNTQVARIEPTERASGPNASGAMPMSETDSTEATSSGSAMSNGGSSMAANSIMSNSAAAPNAASSMSNLSAKPAPPVASPNAGSARSNAASVSNSAVASSQRDKSIETAKSELQKQSDAAAINDKFGSNSSFEPQKTQPADDETTRAAQASGAFESPPAPKPALQRARSAPAELPVNGRMTDELKNAPAKKSKPAAEIRAAGGKTFRRENGVWYDASYNGQTTTNIGRGSAEFKKLDASVRSIAASLSGAVVVLYNGRAYRIQ